MTRVGSTVLRCGRAQAEFWRLGEGSSPPLLLLPGALASASAVVASASVLAERFQVGVLALAVPGAADVGFSRADALGLIAQAAGRLRADAVDADLLLVLGESVGGVFALEAVAATPDSANWRVLCIDPPLAPARLWPVRQQLARALRSSAPSHRRFIAELARDLFGYGLADLGAQALDGQGAEALSYEPVYYPLLATCPVQVLILTGDEPLWPVRSTRRVPCCLDGADRFFIRHCLGEHVRLEVLEQVGHLLLRARPRVVLERALHWLEVTA